MIVVSNTTPLIGLASIQQFALLTALFGEVHIPQAVFDEAYHTGNVKHPIPVADWINVSASMTDWQ